MIARTKEDSGVPPKIYIYSPHFSHPLRTIRSRKRGRICCLDLAETDKVSYLDEHGYVKITPRIQVLVKIPQSWVFLSLLKLPHAISKTCGSGN